jgi:hypothetical protein
MAAGSTEGRFAQLAPTGPAQRRRAASNDTYTRMRSPARFLGATIEAVAMTERVFAEKGRPNAYIVGSEARAPSELACAMAKAISI